MGYPAPECGGGIRIVRCAMNCIHNSSGGSLRELLSRNVGQYAAASFLVGLLSPGAAGRAFWRRWGRTIWCCGRGTPAPGATCMP